MSEKNTKNAGRFKHLFGFDRDKQEDDRDEVTEDIFSDDSEDMPDSAKAESKKTAASEGSVADIEKEARNFYNNHHAQSVEDRVRSIHENALHSYANESEEEPAPTEEEADTAAEETDVSDTSDTEYVQADESAETPDEESADSADDYAEDDADSVSGDFGETKNYDMSRLISVLKDTKNGAKRKKYENEDEDVYEYEDDPNQTDDTLDIHDSELYDDVNEYRHDFEYTDRVQGAALFADFRKSAVIATISVVLSLLATVVCVWFELGHGAGLPFSGMMMPGRYGRVYAMICLQVLALAVFFNLDGLSRGFRKLSLKRPAPEAVAAVSVSVCALHTVYTAAAAYEASSYKTYCFAGCFILFVLSVNTFVKAYTRFKSFAMVLSKKPKLATKNLDHLAEEFSAFDKYLSEDSEVLAVTKTASVSDFVKRTYTVPSALRSCNAFMYAMLVFGLVAAFAGVFFLNKSPYEAISGGLLIYLFSAPVGMLLATALPYFVSSMKASALHAAILGEAAGDFLDNAAVLSFDDTEVFPPKTVKITNIKTYNEHRIDKIVVYMTAIFNKIGGPLSYVFASSLQEVPADVGEIMVHETSADGLHLKVGEDDVLVGTSAYLRMFDIETPVDAVDETEIRSLTSILFLVCNNEIAAKFYIRYSFNRRFEPVLRGIYDAGICCGIRTFDPGVDDQLVAGNLKETNYPIHVIRKDIKEIGHVEESLSSSVISLSSIHNYLKAFLLVDRLNGLYRTAKVLSIIGALVGLALSAFFFVTGGTLAASSLLLFQIFWLLPPAIFSFLGK